MIAIIILPLSLKGYLHHSLVHCPVVVHYLAGDVSLAHKNLGENRYFPSVHPDRSILYFLLRLVFITYKPIYTVIIIRLIQESF